MTLISLKTRLRKLEKRGGRFKPHRLDHTWETVERDRYLCRTFEAHFKEYLPGYYRFGEPQTDDLEVVGRFGLKNFARIVSELDSLSLEELRKVRELAPLVDLARTAHSRCQSRPRDKGGKNVE